MNDCYLSGLQNLLNQKKEYYKIDLHIHSLFSADGEDSIPQIIDRAVENKFDVIAITDHDDCRSVKEIAKIKENTNEIVVIPGIEFTVYNKTYGSMFHVLQYGIDPDNPKICELINQNKNASIWRLSKQCELLKHNPIYRHIFAQSGVDLFSEIIKVSVHYPPDYLDIAKYILDNIQRANMNMDKVLSVFEDAFIKDSNCVRGKLNMMNLMKVKQRMQKGPYDSSRMLMKLISNINTEDSQYKADPPSGNISISNYGQITIDQISESFVTVVAHPTYDKFMKLDQRVISKFDMIEDNYSNKRTTREELLEIQSKMGVPVTIGSDFHYSRQNYYELNPNFYLMSFDRLAQIYQILKEKREEHE